LKFNIPEEIITRQLSMFAPRSEPALHNLLARDYSRGLATVDGFRDTIMTAIEAVKAVDMRTDVWEAVLNLYKRAGEMGFGNKGESAILEVLLNEKQCRYYKNTLCEMS
jgi:3-hydroxyisobutyrate dehydrogenase-like beta-hydroxyacid dehydrogenase